MKKQIFLAGGITEKMKFFLHGKELVQVVISEVRVRVCGQELSHLEGCKWDGSHYRRNMILYPTGSDSSAQSNQGEQSSAVHVSRDTNKYAFNLSFGGQQW